MPDLTPTERRRGNPRQVCYLYRCQRCKVPQRGGSNLKFCKNRIPLIMGWYVCHVSLDRIKTVKGPIPSTLRIV